MRYRSVACAVVLVLIGLGSQGLAAPAFGSTQEGKPPQQAAQPSGAQSASPASSATGDDYVVGAEDVLLINVWKEPEMTRTVPVRPDGKITLPLVGDIEASGLTPRQLQASIAKLLAAYISNPDVSVSVQEVRSQKFNVVGQVVRPGTYNLNGPMTVLDAIAAAGGLRDWAKGKKIYVLREKQGGGQVRLPFNYAAVIKGEQLDQNVELQRHDTVVVP